MPPSVSHGLPAINHNSRGPSSFIQKEGNLLSGQLFEFRLWICMEQTRSKGQTIKNLLLAGSLLTLASTVASSLHISYRGWQRRELERIQTRGLIAKTALGPVEYQFTGHGQAVIYAHGTPGGYDQGISFARFFGGVDDLDCMFISPSRPGYLRTPLSSGATPEAQANLYAALLDTLGIEKAS